MSNITHDFVLNKKTHYFPSSEAFHLLKNIVDIDSETKKVSGIMKVLSCVGQELNDIGFDVEFIPNPTVETAPLLVATYSGVVEDSIYFISHADVVSSVSENFHFSYDDGVIRGPGVADDKGGIVTALMGVKSFLATNRRPYYSLKFVCSPNEETGSIGFHHIFNKLTQNAKLVLGFEPALKDGSIITSRSGNRWYDLCVKGIRSHAGRFNQPSLNAAHETSLIISKLSSLNDLENKMKLNVGSISGGTGHHNIVCDHVITKIDMRFPCLDTLRYMHREFEEIVNRKYLSCAYSGNHCVVDYKVVDDCPPMPLGDDRYDLISLYKNTYQGLCDRRIDDHHAGGAADINYFSNGQAILIDGLGPVGYGMHTLDEEIQFNELNLRIDVLSKFLRSIQSNTTRGVLC